MTGLEQLGIFVTAVIAGGLGSMCGLGGGIFIVPVLSVLLGVDLKAAIAASAVCVVVNSLSGTAVYLRSHMVNVRLGLLLQITTTLGAIVGGFLVVYAPVNTLKLVFAVTMYAIIIVMVRAPEPADPIADQPDPLRLGGAYQDPALQRAVSYVPIRVPLGVGVSSIAGVVSGLLGIGGGAVQVPLMNTVMRIPLKASAATSTFMVGVTASVSALIYFSSGLVSPAVTVPALVGIVLGSQVGSRLGRHVPTTTLLRVLVVVLAILATMILLEALGITG